jgi:hypothetical protein
MANFKLNPEAVSLQIIVQTSFQNLEYAGWDFDSIYEQTAKVQGISFDAAKEQTLNSYSVQVKLFTATDGKVMAEFRLYNHNMNECTAWEEADGEQSVKDIVELLENNMLVIIPEDDHSKDSSGEWVDTFLEE